MKWILIFLCLPAFGQLPVLPFAPTTSSAATTFSLLMWQDALNNVSNSTLNASPPANNGVVGGWGDMSGHANHLQTDARGIGGINGCTYQTSGGANNNPYVRINDAPLTNKTATASGTNTLMMVILDIQPIASYCILNGSASQCSQWNTSSGPQQYQFANGTAGNLIAVATFMSASAWHVVTWQVSGQNAATSLVRVDGTNVTSISPFNAGTSTQTGITIGAFFNATGQASGLSMEEWRWYTGFMSTTDIHTKEQDLGTKWGITIH